MKQRQSSPASPQCHCAASCSGGSSSILLAPTLQTLTAGRETPFASRSHGMMMLSRWLHGKLARQASPGQALTILRLCCHSYLASGQRAAALGICVPYRLADIIGCLSVRARPALRAGIQRHVSNPIGLHVSLAGDWFCTLIPHLSRSVCL